jgi:hypothetical protein
MANFKVITDAEGSYDNYAEGSKHSFNVAGLLVAVRPDGQRRTYSPSGWLVLEDVASKPGAPKAPRRIR